MENNRSHSHTGIYTGFNERLLGIHRVSHRGRCHNPLWVGMAVLGALVPRRHDLSTLGGFVLKLRDDLQKLVDEFPKPASDITGVRNDDMIRKIERLDTPASLRASAL